MTLFPKSRIATHLLGAAVLLLGVVTYVTARNWETFALMYDNATAMNEGGAVAEDLRRPEDLLGYIAAHPDQASLATYEVGARAEGLFFRARVRRPVVNTSHLLLLAEYARRVEAGHVTPSRPVPLDTLATYALPGAGQDQHEEARARWRREGFVEEGRVALRHVVDAVAGFGDPAAADWLMATLGRSRVATMPRRWGLADSDPPMPNSGLYLSWSHHAQTTSVAARLEAYRDQSRTAYADRVYRLARTLRRDSSFRRAERKRLRRRGTALSLRDQRALARATYPAGTAADYADFLGRLLRDSSSAAARFVTRQIETVVENDSTRTAIASIGTHTGAMPGLISFVGYVRFAGDRPPRVATLFLEGLPMGVFYHLVQTGLDKGFQLRLLSDPAFFRRVRERLAGSAAAADEPVLQK